MDLLEKYKNAWKNQSEEANKLSQVEIYKMSHANSSSIVKWIFIISILEVIFLNGINFFFSDNSDKATELVKDLHLTTFSTVFMVLSYGILFYFLVQFYLNYKNISVTDNTKTLMLKILKTRKTVKYYVAFNLISIAIFMIVLFTSLVHEHFSYLSSSRLTGMIIGGIIMLLVSVFLVWLFYQLIYGILLRKLNRNYKELAKLDELS